MPDMGTLLAITNPHRQIGAVPRKAATVGVFLPSTRLGGLKDAGGREWSLHF